MRIRWTVKMTALMLVFLVGVLSACSGSDIRSVDPADVEVGLKSDPSPAKASQPVTLTATFGGVEPAEWAKAVLEIRVDGSMKLVDAPKTPEGGYAAKFTFPKAGTYDIYVHLYQGDFHVTKLKKLEVS